MIYPVYVYGSPVLRKKAKEIVQDYEGLNQLIDDMFMTMYEADGIGFAAPQIGKSVRLIVIDGTRVEDEDNQTLKDFKKVIINPEILEEEGEEWLFNEGCLSIPNIREDISRKPRIRLQYFDEKFNFHDEYFDGIKARVIQHELDHLNGILFVDKIPAIKKKLINGKLNDISKGKTEVSYKIIHPK